MNLISHTMLFASAVVVFVLALATTASVYLRRAQRSAALPDVGALLDQLVAVDRYKLAVVAEDLDCTTAGPGDAEPLEQWQVWEMVGGLAGLESLAANCEVLIDLACHVQRWYPEALPVAEALRMQAREIQWHIERLRGAEARGHLQTAFPDYAQRAVAIYCTMTQHVVALYQASQLPGLSQVEAAL